MLKNSRQRGAYQRGFTLLEVLISALLFAIGFMALVGAVIAGRFFLKQAENKSHAMDVAFRKMEGYLAKSYSGLTTGINSTAEENVTWTANITKDDEGSIPYKRIIIEASYNETDARQLRRTKRVKLENIVPYPLIHTKSKDINISSCIANCAVLPKSTAPAGYKPIGDGLSVTFNYEVTKDVQVIYNIALDLADTSGVDPVDTIWTQCFLDGDDKDSAGNKIPMATRTPIMTQPLISSDLALEDIPSGSHTIEIKWYKDTSSGNITFKTAELITVAFESE